MIEYLLSINWALASIIVTFPFVLAPIVGGIIASVHIAKHRLPPME